VRGSDWFFIFTDCGLSLSWYAYLVFSIIAFPSLSILYHVFSCFCRVSNHYRMQQCLFYQYTYIFSSTHIAKIKLSQVVYWDNCRVQERQYAASAGFRITYSVGTINTAVDCVSSAAAVWRRPRNWIARLKNAGGQTHLRFNAAVFWLQYGRTADSVPRVDRHQIHGDGPPGATPTQQAAVEATS